jgi:hypothetical protein
MAQATHAYTTSNPQSLLAGHGEETSAFELFLQCLAFGFCAFEQSVSLADRVGEGRVGVSSISGRTARPRPVRPGSVTYVRQHRFPKNSDLYVCIALA